MSLLATTNAPQKIKQEEKRQNVQFAIVGLFTNTPKSAWCADGRSPVLNPGPELDKMVAEALGWNKTVVPADHSDRAVIWTPPGGSPPNKGFRCEPPPFSTDPGEAVKALEEFCGEPNRYECVIEKNNVKGGQTNSVFIYQSSISRFALGKAQDIVSLAHAICTAIYEAAGEGK